MKACVIVAVLIAAGCADDAPPASTLGMDPIITLYFDSLYAPTHSALVGLSADGLKVAVTPDAESGEIYLFESGQLTAVYQAKGRGPAEVARITDVLFGPNDSIYVLDADNAKVLVLSPTLQPVRSSAVAPGTTRFTLAEDGTLLLAVNRRGTVELAILDNNGIAPFATLRVKNSGVQESALVANSPDGIWIASGGAYEVTRLSSSGSVESVLERRPDWWDHRPENADRFAPGLGTESRLLDLSAEPGIVWVLAGTPPGRYPDADPRDLDFRDPSVLNQLGDLVIEAVDAASGELLGMIRIDELGMRLLPGGSAWALEFDSSGEPRIAVVKLRLEDADRSD